MAGILTTLLTLTGCGTPSPVTLLDTLVTAAAAAVAAVPILESTGVITVATGTVVVNYADAVNTATEKALTEEASSDTQTVKVEKIIADFAGIAAPALGPNAAAEVQAVVLVIEAAMNAFLGQMQGQVGVMVKAGKYTIPLGDAAKIKGTVVQTARSIEAWREAHR
jgi:hypothetical protein